jgi:hypothetical protein
MTPPPFARILVGYIPTEQGADARAVGVDLGPRVAPTSCL